MCASEHCAERQTHHHPFANYNSYLTKASSRNHKGTGDWKHGVQLDILRDIRGYLARQQVPSIVQGGGPLPVALVIDGLSTKIDIRMSILEWQIHEPGHRNAEE